MPFEDEYEEREYLDSFRGKWEEKELQPVEEERDEMLAILRGIVNNAQYYKHGIWTVPWEQIEKAKKKVEGWG